MPGQLANQTNIALLTTQIAVTVWIFALGACFGSFLNVVIYRLPEGLSLGRPKSRCPRCETPLAPKDNIPIFGWLLLKGKCRYCRLPIAARYPVVEATCGLVMLSLLFGELLTGAANLPLRRPGSFQVHSGFWMVWLVKWDLSGVFLYHSCLLIVTLAAVMIGYDRHRPQPRLIVFGVLVGLTAGSMWPGLRPVSAMAWPADLTQMALGFHWDSAGPADGRFWTGLTLVGLLDGLLGAIGGCVFGALAYMALSRGANNERKFIAGAIAVVFVHTGAYLGWQASGMFALAAIPIVACSRWSGRCCPSSAWARVSGPLVFLSLCLFVLLWAWLDQRTWFVGVRGWEALHLPWWQEWFLTAAGISAVYFGISCVPQTETSPDLVELSPEVSAVEANGEDAQMDNDSPASSES